MEATRKLLGNRHLMTSNLSDRIRNFSRASICSVMRSAELVNKRDDRQGVRFDFGHAFGGCPNSGVRHGVVSNSWFPLTINEYR